MLTKLVLGFPLLGIACSSGAVNESIPPPAPPAAIPVADASVPDAKPAVSEVEARHLLNSMFRQAQLRVVNDVPFSTVDIEVTLDGYDPERQIGYEYVARREEGRDVSPAELAWLREHGQIFVATGTTLEELRQRAEEFLASLPAANAEIEEEPE